MDYIYTFYVPEYSMAISSVVAMLALGILVVLIIYGGLIEIVHSRPVHNNIFYLIFAFTFSMYCINLLDRRMWDEPKYEPVTASYVEGSLRTKEAFGEECARYRVDDVLTTIFERCSTGYRVDTETIKDHKLKLYKIYKPFQRDYTRWFPWSNGQ